MTSYCLMNGVCPDGRPHWLIHTITLAVAAKSRAAKRWHVYLILCRGGAIYTGIARDVAVRHRKALVQRTTD